MDSLLLIDKPTGMTSHDVVARVRRALGTRKVGHAGTLDPQATGLLVVAVGQATRWLNYLPQDKRYQATLKLGLETDTQDIWGKVLRESSETAEVEAVRTVLESFRGKQAQVPPMVSALKKDGRKLYELAREGQEVERAPREVEIYSLDVIRVQPPEADFQVHCSSGTYVRTLCHDAGQKLGTGGCLSALRRTQVGPFKVSDALRLEDLSSASIRWIGAEQALAHLPILELSPEEEALVKRGQDIPFQGGASDQAWRLVSAGKLVAFGRPIKEGSEWRLHPEKVFLEEASLLALSEQSRSTSLTAMSLPNGESKGEAA
jgi:tRNA pseudouridine55 synthase